MKTTFQSSDFVTMQRQSNSKSKTVKASSRKSERYVYPDLNEFLSQYSVFTVNEYGEKVISGKRIC